jgi:subtilisin family serine protease
VTVVVLDSAPGRQRIADAASQTGNPLLGSLLDGQLTELRTVPPLPALPLVAVDGQQYRMADHGLFVASLIHAVAPQATIKLWRVLNDQGVGTLASLLNGLAAAFDEPGPLVVNLSLVLKVPIEELEALWSTRRGKAGARPVPYRIRALFDRGLTGVFGPLSQDGRLIVAAAGNDSLNLADRREPRYPARYDNVLAVAALAGNGQPASYANEGDAPAAINGVATFGGNARQVGTFVLIPDNTVSGHPSAPPTFPDAPIGLVTSQTVPERAGSAAPTDQPNETGWAAWAGSSFATPLVSGIAACLLSGDPTLTADQVIAKVLGYATDSTADPELLVNGIRAIQF